MEFIVPKVTKSRTQKRQKRLIKNRRRNQRKKLEVKLSKRRSIMRDNNYAGVLNKNDNYCTMSANAFWENYKAAHDWQYRHNVAWWKSRCIALEDENRALRDKIRELAAPSTRNSTGRKILSTENFQNHYYHNDEEEEEEVAEVCHENEVYGEGPEDPIDSRNETLEFHVDEDMMKFLEQSIRHKMELKRMRESEDRDPAEDQESKSRIENQQLLTNSRIEDSKLLYGAASSRILAMETALQARIDYHKDRAQPHYWPNIPLKP